MSSKQEPKLPKVKFAEFIMNDLTEWLLYLAVLLLVLDQIIARVLGISILGPSTAGFRTSLGLSAMVLFIASNRKHIKQLMDRIDSLFNKYLGVLEVLHPHETVDFKQMLESCKEIRVLTLSGTKVASLGDENISDLIASPGRKSKIKILLGNSIPL